MSKKQFIILLFLFIGSISFCYTFQSPPKKIKLIEKYNADYQTIRLMRIDGCKFIVYLQTYNNNFIHHPKCDNHQDGVLIK